MMKHQRQLFLALSILLVMTIFLPSAAFCAGKNDLDTICLTKLQVYNPDCSSVEKPVTLYNNDGNVEAVCYTLKPAGYVIINPTNYLLIEFSFEGTSPFNSAQGADEKSLIYNGPGEYYQKDGSTLTHLYSKEKVNTSEFKTVSSNNIAKNNLASALSADAIVAPMTVVEQTSIKYTLHNWYTSSYCCGINACAIVLMYYQEHMEGTYLPTNRRTSATICAYLLDGHYLWNQGISNFDLVNGYGSSFSGLTQYFTDNVTGTAKKPHAANYSWASAISLIKNGRPVILGTNPTHPQINASHHIIAHTYVIATENQTNFLVNDGWGHNNVYVTSDPQYYCGMTYIS